MKLAIVHAAGFAPPYGGNFVSSLRALDLLCKERGWTSVLALPAAAAKRDWCARLVGEGWQVRFLPDQASVSRYAWALADIALTSNAAVVHTHFSQYDIAAWAANCVLRLRRRQVHVVWHAHSDFGTRMTPLRRMKDVLKYRVMGRGVHIIAVSDHLRQRMVEVGFNPAAIHTVHNGIDLDRAVAAARSRAQVFDELHIPPGKHLLLVFGWDPVTKGVDVAMDACERLVVLGLPVVLAIVGTATLVEFVLRRTDGRLPAWLRILPPTEDVAGLYQAASLFLSTSRSEGFSYSIGEAMVNRTPVVLSDLPGVSWARGTPGARFFPPGDCVALAAVIGEVLRWNTEERELRTAASEQLIRARFNVSCWAGRVLRLYRELLGASRTPGRIAISCLWGLALASAVSVATAKAHRRAPSHTRPVSNCWTSSFSLRGASILSCSRSASDRRLPLNV